MNTLRISDLPGIFFCTGARNHDLLKFLPETILRFEYDERMASFKALGLAKASGKPVGICTTSGTAVSECLSAMLEAQYGDIPLILITGDRPTKQHGTGAPQTINHEPLTRGVRGSFVEITLAELENLEIRDPVYPLHINVLVDDTSDHGGFVKKDAPPTAFPEFLALHKRPLFLFSHEHGSMRPFVEKFRETGLPFFAETMSQARHLSSIAGERELLRLFEQKAFDSVVRVGHTPLSKIWRLLEKKFLPVLSFDSRGLPALSYGTVVRRSSREILEDPQWWTALAQCRLELSSIPTADEQLLARWPNSELALFQKLQDLLLEDSLVYLGNSLIIRHFELVQKKAFRVHGNRGVNGIDGQLATAIGLALGTTEMVTCILGDITTLYDLSSLREMPDNLRLIIINNGGGRIFDTLSLDKRIVLEHDFTFGGVCRGLNLSYSDELKSLGNVQVLELKPSQEDSESLRKEWP